MYFDPCLHVIFLVLYNFVFGNLCMCLFFMLWIMGVKGFHKIYCLYANTGASKELLSELKSGSTKASKRFLSGLKCKLGILAADSWGQTAPKRVNDHSHPIASMENGR